MATVTTTTTSATDEAAAIQRTKSIDHLRHVCYSVGAVQLAWGLVGFALSFTWVSNALTLASGAVAVGAWCVEIQLPLGGNGRGTWGLGVRCP